MARRRHVTRQQRTTRALLAGACLLALAWQAAPIPTVLALVAAAGAAAAWWRWRATRPDPDPRPGWVYHLPGWDGRLVYVGMTNHPTARLRQHMGIDGPPSWFAAHVDWQAVRWFGPFDGRTATHRAEIDHIHTYEPWANRLRYEHLRRHPALRRLGRPAYTTAA